jgi:aconitase A
MNFELKIKRSKGIIDTIQLLSRVDTDGEADYYCHGGILHYVLRQLAS